MAWASQIEAWNDGATLPTGRQCRHPLRRVPLTSACQLLANPDEAAVDSHDFMHQRDFAVIRSVLSTASKQGWDLLTTLTGDPDHLITKLRTA
jgi:hypothetical protein